MFGIGSPQRLLQPFKDLRQFTEELYAMLTSRSPVEHEGPVTIRVKPGQTALKLTSRPSPDEPTPFQVQGRRTATVQESPKPRTSATNRPDQFAPRSSPAPDYGPFRGPIQPTPLLEVDGSVSFPSQTPARFGAPPSVYDPGTKQYLPVKLDLPTLADPVLPIEINPPVTIGRVVSGGGNTYQVALYPDGPAGSQGDTVEVTIPMIDSRAKVPPGTWFVPVIRTGDTYTAQPPVWIDSSPGG